MARHLALSDAARGWSTSSTPDPVAVPCPSASRLPPGASTRPIARPTASLLLTQERRNASRANRFKPKHGVVGAAALPGTGPIGSALVTSALRRAAMDQYVALDVSLKEVSVCVLGADGTLVYEGRTASDPTSLVGL